MDKILIFNWKMSPITLKEAVALARVSDKKNIIIAPPFIFLEKIRGIIRKADLGAQDLFWEDQGAFTGGVSAKQLKNINVEYVLVGHSERRHKIGESDEMVAKKMETAVKNKLTPILCIGETKMEKDAGMKEQVLERQLSSALSCFGNRTLGNGYVLIAYEPVWSIGTGEPESPDSALKTALYIKSLLFGHYKLNAKVLYGGSVNSHNLKNYLNYGEIDGALVGGASLKKDEIKKMISIIK